MSLTPKSQWAGLALRYALVGIFAYLGIGLFYIFFGLTLEEDQFKNALIYQIVGGLISVSIFNIYLPLRYFKKDVSYPERVVLFNVIGLLVLYVPAFFASLKMGWHLHDILKMPFQALSIGIFLGITSFMTTVEALYNEVKGRSKWMSVYYKNLLFVILIVIIGVVVVGSAIASSFEHRVYEGQFIGSALSKVFLACLIATTIVVLLSVKFASVMSLPIKELSNSIRAFSEGGSATARSITSDEVADLIDAFNKMADKIKDREEELIFKGQQLALLYRFAESLNQKKDVSDLFEITMQWLEGAFGFEIGALRLAKNGFLKLTVSKGLPEESIKEIKVVKMEDSIAGLAVLRNEPIIIEDVDSSPEDSHATIAKELGIKSIISIPLRSRQGIIGTLSAASLTRKNLHGDNLYLLNSIANLLGVAVDRSLEFHRVEEERFQWESAVSHIKDLISIHDSQWRIKRVNPAFLEHFNLKEEDVIGRHCFEVFHGLNTPPHDCPNIEALITRERSTQTITDGNKHFTFSVHPIIKEHGQIDGCIHIVRDVTEMVRLRENAHQSDKLGAIGRLTASIAHNINNPLTYSLNYLYILRESMPDEKLQLIRKAEQGIERAKDVLERLLEFSSPRAEDISAIDLEEAIDSTLGFLSTITQSKGVSIRKDISEKLYARASKKALEEVLMNLITNSIDAGAKDITIEGYSDPNDITLIITDNGSGIDKEHMPRLFEPYFTTKPRGKGTGLGLYISYNIIKSFGGNLWCSSKKDSGTQFFILLPKGTVQKNHNCPI